MKPPTDKQINEEVDDGYGLKWEGEPFWIIQAEIDLLKAELDALEMTSEMTIDRWGKQEKFLKDVIRHCQDSIEFEVEWMDEPDPVVIARDQQRLQDTREQLRKETEEFEKGRKDSKEAIAHKKRQIAVVADVLRRAQEGPA